MPTELAAAYVTIIPSLKGASSKIGKELSGIDMSYAGSAMGAQLGTSMGGGLASSLNRAGNTLTGIFGKIVKPAAAAVGGIGAALIGITAQGGISRALNIEQANTLLRGMKMTEEQIASVMDSANTSVKGTAFGLDAAAKAAAGLAASGVPLGDDMTKALQGVAGVATMAGTSMEDIADIYQKVAAKGKLTGDELNRLSERGVAARQVLAEQLGISGEELNEMVRNGEISFEQFAKAMHTAFGEAAYGANNTFTGALANVKAALSRIGAKFAQPFMDVLRESFAGAIPIIDQINEALTPLVDKFTEFSNVVAGRVKNALQAVSDTLKGQPLTVKSFVDALHTGFVTLVGDADKAGEIINRLMQFGSITGIIGALGASLKTASIGVTAFTGLGAKASGAWTGFSGRMRSLAFTVMPGLEGALAQCGGKVGLLQALFPKFGGVIGAIGGPIGKVVSVIGSLMGGMLKLGGALMGAGVGFLALGVAAVASGVDLEAVADKALTAITEFANKLPMLMTKFLTQLPGLMSKVAEALPQILQAITTALQAVVEQLPYVIQVLVGYLPDMINQLIVALVDMAPLIVDAGIQLFIGLVESLAQVMPTLIEQIPVLVKRIGAVLIENAPAILAALGQLGLAILEGLGTLFLELFGWIQAKVQELFANIAQWFSEKWESLKQAASESFQHLKDGFVEGWGHIVDFVSSIPGRIVGFFAGAGGWLIGKGLEIFRGLKDGIVNAWNAIVTWFSMIPTRIANFFSGAGEWLLNAGKQILSGLWEGLKAKWEAVKDWFSSLGEKIISLKGPPSYDAVMLVENGRLIMEGLLKGLEEGSQGLEGVLGRVKSRIEDAGNATRKGSSTIASDVVSAFNGIEQPVMGAMTSVANSVKNSVSNISATTSGIKGSFTTAFNGSQSWLKTSGSGIIKGLISGLNVAKTLVRAALIPLKSAITSAISNPGNLLSEKGKLIMRGLINGIKAMIPALKATLKSVTNSIPSWKGPYSVDRVLLYDNGQIIMQGLLRGIRSEIPALVSTLGDVTNAIDVGGSVKPYDYADVDARPRAYSGSYEREDTGKDGMTINMNVYMNEGEDIDHFSRRVVREIELSKAMGAI